MDFIITCGTSQTDKVDNPAIPMQVNLKSCNYEDLKSNYWHAVPSILDEKQFLTDANPPSAAIVKSLTACLGAKDRVQRITEENNPLGAELSTLIRYMQDGNLEASGHTFHILHSDTYPGWFNALLLQQTAAAMEWAVPADIDLHKIDNLRDKPAEGNDPLQALSRAVNDILPKLKNPVIIASGGYKSVIPCMTIYALLYAVPLIYLFEKSDQLVNLTPVVTVANQKKFHQLWKKMADLRIAENTLWFNDALMYRKDHDLSFIS